MNSAQPDMELRKAFLELQQKMISSKNQIKISEMQKDTLKKKITRSKLVQKELSGIPDETNFYEGVGRIEIDELLKQQLSDAEEKIKSIEEGKKYLEKSVKESEDNLRELISSKQQQK